MAVVPHLHDQCYLRSMSKQHPGWQKLAKAELVGLYLKHNRRTAYRPGEDSEEDPTESDAWSDQIELHEPDEDTSSDDAWEAEPVAKRVRIGILDDDNSD